MTSQLSTYVEFPNGFQTLPGLRPDHLPLPALRPAFEHIAIAVRCRVLIRLGLGLCSVEFGPASFKPHEPLALTPQLPHRSRHAHAAGEQLARLEDRRRNVAALPLLPHQYILQAGAALAAHVVARFVQWRIEKWKVLVGLVILLFAGLTSWSAG